jgi:hypothetical protein
MFDVRVDVGSSKILIKSIEFEHLRGSANAPSTVDVYTTYYGSLTGKENQSSQWKKYSTVSFPNNSTSNTTVTFDPPISMWSGSAQGFYLVAKEGILLVGLGPLDKADGHGVSIENGNVVFGGQFGKAYSGYYLNARVGYDFDNNN